MRDALLEYDDTTEFGAELMAVEEPCEAEVADENFDVSNLTVCTFLTMAQRLILLSSLQTVGSASSSRVKIRIWPSTY